MTDIAHTNPLIRIELSPTIVVPKAIYTNPPPPDTEFTWQELQMLAVKIFNRSVEIMEEERSAMQDWRKQHD